MSLGAAWWKPPLPSCPCRHQSYPRERAKNAFQGRTSVSAFTQLPLNSLGLLSYELLHSGQPLWLLLLWLVPECPYSLQPHQSSSLLAEGPNHVQKSTILQHSLFKAHQPSQVTWRHKQPSGVSTSPQEVSTGHRADCSRFGGPWGFCYSLHQADPSILIWLVLGSPLGSPASPTPSLSRLVICVIPLALIRHSPVGFSSHTAQQMLHVWAGLVSGFSFIQPYTASLLQAKQWNGNTHTPSFCSHNNSSTKYSEKLPYIPCLWRHKITTVCLILGIGLSSGFREERESIFLLFATTSSSSIEHSLPPVILWGWGGIGN